MTDKQIKAPKPAPVKPVPVKPATTKPETVKPVKAHTCLRCTGKVPSYVGDKEVCHTCDLELQHMHWSAEQSVFGKVMYMSERAAQALRDRLPVEHSAKVHKPRRPYSQHAYFETSKQKAFTR